jgi:hypothetical protein
MLAAACGGSGGGGGSVASPIPSANPNCVRPSPTPAATVSAGGVLPPAISQVADQVAKVRGLAFERPVAPEPLTTEQINGVVRDQLEEELPVDRTANQQRAWIAMGVLPGGTDLRQSVIDFETSEIIGFYDSSTHQLVFVGGQAPTPFERLTLAHELTHALDDQHFDLTRLDALDRACLDDRAEAFLSLAEGNAQETMIRWGQANLSAQDRIDLQTEVAEIPPPPAGIPPFVQDLFSFPYPNGQAFVEALLAKGGEGAVNDAFRNPPASTEQVLHPDKYPGDAPQVVAVPDLGPKLGNGWNDLDFQDVGEGWLRLMLALRASEPDAEAAAAGWDGGQYRAWAKGSSTAVVLDTVWDSAFDANEFVEVMTPWLGAQPSAVLPNGLSVRVLFASDAATLATLRAVAS